MLIDMIVAQNYQVYVGSRPSRTVVMVSVVAQTTWTNVSPVMEFLL